MKQTTITLLAALCLLLCGCAADELPGGGVNGDVRLRPGEQAVMFSLSGVSSGGGVPASRAEAGAAETIAGESEVRSLRIYCFVNTSGSASSESTLTLERTYSYEQGGAANDFTLSPQADGYRLGIGVPEDDRERRFLMLANTPALTGLTAVAATETDRSSATALQSVRATQTAESAAALAAPFPMSSQVPKPVLMNDGTYRYDEGAVFTSADLAGGLKVRLKRRVARVDISNPFVSQFVLSKLSYTRQNKAGLFDGTGGSTSSTSAIGLPLTDAELLPGAVYSYPGTFTLTLTGTYLGAETTVTVPEATLAANSRYVVRVKSKESNVVATLEVLPWDEGDDIEAEVTATTYNTAVASVTGRFEGDGCFGLIDPQERVARVALNSIVCASSDGGMLGRGAGTASGSEGWVVKEFTTSGSRKSYQITSYPFVRFTGTAGNGDSIGVILSAPLRGRVKVARQNAAADGTAEVRLYLIPTADEIAYLTERVNNGAQSTIRGAEYFVRRTVPSAAATVTLVTQDAATGALSYEDWRVVEDCFSFQVGGDGTAATSIPAAEPADVSLRTTSSWVSSAWTLDEATPIPLSPYVGEVSLCLDPEASQGGGGMLTRTTVEMALNPSSDGSAYVEAEGEPWAAVNAGDVLDISGQGGGSGVMRGTTRAARGDRRILTTVQDNMTGAERRATLVVRWNTHSGYSDSGSGGILNSRSATSNDPTVLPEGARLQERRYTLVQPPVTAAVYAQMAPSAELRLGNGYPVDELYRDGNTIYVGKTNTKLSILNPCHVVSDGRKPVRIIIPAGCDWLYESLEYAGNKSSLVPTRGQISGIDQSDYAPPGFVRQLRLLPNEAGADRSVSFSVQTYAGGRLRTETYKLVQRPTATSSGGGGSLPL